MEQLWWLQPVLLLWLTLRMWHLLLREQHYQRQLQQQQRQQGR
jgi:hypothetical protein